MNEVFKALRVSEYGKERTIYCVFSQYHLNGRFNSVFHGFKMITT